ncbi:hypothetical protein PENTCL1PPCAC_23141 [Pristionchus entomophagus]|uniref:Programmed cell death protein 5 n=1 Tax=Pristionchus entomophagus TaxID=358040 RepID=A0AAV5U2I0_9BILA|nr:hypothetical protein PENTCL1PPCAC_23141 [Pristionchus entomophagus]
MEGIGPSPGNAGAQQEQARQAAEKRENAQNSMLSQILEQDAMVRLNNLAAAKPDKAKMAEATIINMARRGQIAGKLSDEGLKQILNRVSDQSQSKTTVHFDRRRNAIDSDSD